MYHTGVIHVTRIRRTTANRPCDFLTLQLLISIFFSLLILYVLFAISGLFLLIFHIDIVYECIVLRCIVENKLTYLGGAVHYCQHFPIRTESTNSETPLLHPQISTFKCWLFSGCPVCVFKGACHAHIPIAHRCTLKITTDVHSHM